MILKEKQFVPQTDPRLVAGDAAEKQMAFYLKRTFSSAKDIWIINDLRVEHEGEAAQIDHLLVTQWGLFIVESKSVTGSVHINPHGEWVREYENGKKGMPSPILQAEAQGQLLKVILQANVTKLLGTLVGLQKGFGCCPVLVYAAVSDGGIIRREMDLPQVMKADAVAPAIKAWLKNCSVVKGLLSLSLDVKPGEWAMTKKEAEAVAVFLVSRHSPLDSPPRAIEEDGAIESGPVQVELIEEGRICPECRSHKLVRKSIARGGASTRDFLACVAYPKSCKAIYPLPIENHPPPPQVSFNTKPGSIPLSAARYQIGDACPWCKDGKLVERKGKTTFLGCSNYTSHPKCKFTDYRDKTQDS